MLGLLSVGRCQDPARNKVISRIALKKSLTGSFFFLYMLDERQFLRAREALYFSLALLSRTPVWILLCIHNAFNFSCSGEVTSFAILVFGKSSPNISRDACVERAVPALQ